MFVILVKKYHTDNGVLFLQYLALKNNTQHQWFDTVEEAEKEMEVIAHWHNTTVNERGELCAMKDGKIILTAVIMEITELHAANI